MATNSFYPKNETLKINWLKNYAAKLPEYGVRCDISGDDITSSLKDTTYQLWLLEQLHPAKLSDLKAVETFVTQLLTDNSSAVSGHPEASSFTPPPPMPLPGIEQRLFSVCARIKASLHYNEDVGRKLDIVSTVTKIDHPIPEFTACEELGVVHNRIRLDFKKHRHDGVHIESNINGGDFAFLAISTVKPYLDECPLADGNTHEVREYRMRWWDKNVAHGEWSAIQRVALGK